MLRTNVWKPVLLLAVVAALFAAASDASADLIVQDAGADHLAFNAVDYDSLVDDATPDGENWAVVADLGSSSGQVLKAPNSGFSEFENEGEAVYKLRFTKPTDGYRVFARYKNLGSGSSDSFKTGPNSNWFPTTTLGVADGDRFLSSESATTGQYFYSFLGWAAPVVAGDYEFRVGVRDPNTEIDRFIFVDGSTGGSAPLAGIPGSAFTREYELTVLDGLVNSTIQLTSVPEPTAFAFGSLVVMLGIASKGRGRVVA